MSFKVDMVQYHIAFDNYFGSFTVNALINTIRVSRDQVLLNLKNDYSNSKANNKQGEEEKVVLP